MSVWDTLEAKRRSGLEAGDAAVRWLKRGESIERWREVGVAASDLQAAAMEAAHTNKPTGRGYNAAWADLAGHVPHLRDLDTPTRSHAMWLALQWEPVSLWLHTLAANERMRLNHPTAIRRRYDAATKVPVTRPEGDDAPRGYKAALAEAEAKIATLEQRLKTEGSLFNYDSDTVTEIARAMRGNGRQNRAVSVAKEILKQDKEAKAKAGHAG